MLKLTTGEELLMIKTSGLLKQSLRATSQKRPLGQSTRFHRAKFIFNRKARLRNKLSLIIFRNCRLTRKILMLNFRAPEVFGLDDNAEITNA